MWYPQQQKIIESYFAGERFRHYPSLLCVEAGTGVGKTMALIEIGVRLLEKGLVSKVFYSTATKALQISFLEELKKYNRIFGTSFRGTMLVGKTNYISPIRLQKEYERLSDEERKEIRDKEGNILSFEELMEKVDRANGFYDALEVSDSTKNLLVPGLVCMRAGEEETDHAFYYQKAVVEVQNADFVAINHYLAVATPGFLKDMSRYLTIIDEGHKMPYAALQVVGGARSVSLMETARILDVFVKRCKEIKEKLKGVRGEKARRIRKKISTLNAGYEQAKKGASSLRTRVRKIAKAFREFVLARELQLLPYNSQTVERNRLEMITEIVRDFYRFYKKSWVWDEVEKEDLPMNKKESIDFLSLVDEAGKRLARIERAWITYSREDVNEVVYLSFSPEWAFPSFHVGHFSPMPGTKRVTKRSPIIIASATLTHRILSDGEMYADLTEADLGKLKMIWSMRETYEDEVFRGKRGIKVSSPFVENEKPVIFINPMDVPEIADRWTLADLPHPPEYGLTQEEKKSSEKDWLEFNMYLLRYLTVRTDGGILVLCRAYNFVDKFVSLLKKEGQEEDGRILWRGREVLVPGRSFGLKRSDFQAKKEDFIKAGNAIFVATSQAWEGLDVPGKALSAVLITRLPFPPPEDPLILYARRVEEAIKGRNNGLRPSLGFSLMRTLMYWNLRQGIGRLVRSQKDWGYIAIGDGRAYQTGPGFRSYWEKVKAACREVNVTGLEEVERELNSLKAASA